MRPLLTAAAFLCFAGITGARASEIPVSQANHVFSQQTLAVTSGDWVLLSNDDGIPHDLSVTDEDGEPQDLGLQQPGKVLRVHFVNAGEYTIRCSLTPGMRMRVIVR